MEDDLTWLARNVHEWPVGDHQPWCYVITDNSGKKLASGVAFCAPKAPMIEKTDWLARRAELQNKPSWADAPAGAGYMAQEPHGVWTFFVDQPFEPSKLHDDGWRFDGFQAWSSDRRGEVLGDWRDTLERRPESKPEFEQFVSIEDGGPVKAQVDGGWFERGELPPVGVECTAVADGIPDANCIIVAISTEQVVVKWTENQMFDVLGMPGLAFRPIRTERDKSIEEMKQHCPYHGSWDHVGRIYAEALYDAGYRKQEGMK